MAWLTENWIWVLFGLAFVAMHLFGHGGHGGHGSRGGHGGHGGGGCGHGDRRKGDDGSRDAEPQKAGDKPAIGSAAGAPSNHEPHRH
jgi:hypothetical protein